LKYKHVLRFYSKIGVLTAMIRICSLVQGCATVAVRRDRCTCSQFTTSFTAFTYSGMSTWRRLKIGLRTLKTWHKEKYAKIVSTSTVLKFLKLPIIYTIQQSRVIFLSIKELTPCNNYKLCIIIRFTMIYESIFSECECCRPSVRPSVCLSSVCNVRAP